MCRFQSLSCPLLFRALTCQDIVPGHICPMLQDVPLCQSQGVISLYGPPHNSTLYCVAPEDLFQTNVTSVLCAMLDPLPGLDSAGAGGATGACWIVNDHVPLQSLSCPLLLRALTCQDIVPGHICPMWQDVPLCQSQGVIKLIWPAPHFHFILRRTRRRIPDQRHIGALRHARPIAWAG